MGSTEPFGKLVCKALRDQLEGLVGTWLDFF